MRTKTSMEELAVTFDQAQQQSLTTDRKVLVQFGPALGLDAYRERYAVDPRAAVMALTDELHERMSEMVLTAENHELVKLADLVEHMGVTDAGGDSDLKSTFERKKALLEGYARLKQLVPDEMEALRRDLPGGPLDRPPGGRLLDLAPRPEEESGAAGSVK